MTKIWRKPVTQEEVKEFFDYKDGHLYWKKIKKYNHKKVGDLAGRVNANGRRDLGLNSRVFYAARIIFLWHHGWLPDYIDHINRNTLDDRIENLRAATSSQNQANRPKLVNKTSIYKGVSFTTIRSKYGYWTCLIYLNGKSIFIGRFKDEKLAALAYNKEAVKIFGEFAILNIIKP